MYRPLFIGIAFLCCFPMSTPRTYAQDVEKTSGWYKSLFIEAGGPADIPPKMFLGAVKPMFGFRGALGYEWQGLRFSLSSGYSQASGADRLVESLAFTPLTSRLGYALPVKDGWGAQADLGFGFKFSKVLHYETALDFLADRRNESFEIKPLVEGSLYATYTLPRDFLKFYAGGGADILFEKDGPIPLPVIEAGISLKPLALYSPGKRKPLIPVFKPVFPPAPGQEKLAELAVYFRADSGTRVLEQSWPLLREAGRVLQENPQAQITLRGYAAPFGITESQVVISAARVWFCAEYFEQEYGIAENRIHMEFYGSEEKRDGGIEEWPLRRRVEMVIDYSPDEGKMGTRLPEGNHDIEPRPRPDSPTQRQYAIYFEANRGTKMLEQSRPMLREAGRLLRANPQARVTLQGYAAPSGTTEGQVVISAARVWYCVEYLKREYNVSEDRITMQFFGGEESFSSGDPEWRLRRRVEMTVDLGRRR